MSDMDRLEQLRAECLQCERCGLAKTRTKVVFSDGDPRAPLVIVGEGPGEEEDKSGVPFVGRSGKLLDRALLENALTRKWVYICNTVKCRAYDMDGRRAKNRPPTPEEAAACRPWLDEQLQIIRPVVILCLGSPASNAVIHRDFRITQERGRWFTDSPYAPWVMASWHPSYVLRKMSDGHPTVRSELVGDIDQCRKKIIELRQQGGLLARQSPSLPEEVREPDPGLALF